MRVEEEPIKVVMGQIDPISVARGVVRSGAQEEAFYILNLDEVVSRYYNWMKLMPRVEAFYAVKCNPHKLLLRTLAAMGAGFDCASKTELELVSELGVQPERIIFANPTKMPSHIRHAESLGVEMTTFDSEEELYKLKTLMPNAKLLIRIRCDAPHAKCPLGDKFGCDPSTEAPKLLQLAYSLQLNVVGVSFHIGSGASEYSVYARAVAHARALFDHGARAGLRMSLLDIGGGFPGETGTDLSGAAAVINESLATHFPGPDIRVIAEPGRYFACAAFTLVLCVHSKRVVQTKHAEGDTDSHTKYFVNDGVFGSFNGIISYDETFETTQLMPNPSPTQPCSIWGPSCDGVDCIIRSTRLPSLSVGDWVVFRDMGAYTLAVATTFNGFLAPEVQAVISKRYWDSLRDHELFSEVYSSGAEPIEPADHEEFDTKIKSNMTAKLSGMCLNAS